MSVIDRRKFLQLLGSGAVATALPDSVTRALAIPANDRTGTIADVEHIVILTQENRSFDHYFGTMKGVRGFGDPRAVRLPNGMPVWYQPSADGYVLPYRPDADNAGLSFLPDPPHGWTDSHAAWNEGRYDQWVPAKGQSAMTCMTRRDIPYHFALADAFTICDAYHCSLIGPTDPNRYHLWTGWCGNDGKGGGPVITNAEAGYDWSSYPERLQRAGITWKVYQDIGLGLDAAGFWGWTGDQPYIGNYGDNALLYLHQYQNAAPGTPLAVGAKTGTNIVAGGSLFDVLREDVRTGRLPQVSWIAAPEAYSEHPNWPANYGAWYISQILDALTANPEVWSRTVLLLNYDENGGYFDHMVPPTPPQAPAQGLSTVDVAREIFPGDADHAAGPYGLGVRVPLVVISPWSKGGWVNSQVFDHTSIIRFLEARFGHDNPDLIERNITPWRRAVTGDLTTAFDFKHPNRSLVPLPDTAAYLPADRIRHPDDAPVPPTDQQLPAQERGVRRARALPYELHVDGSLRAQQSAFRLDFRNTGRAGAVFHVRSGAAADLPRSYTVEAGKTLADAWPIAGGASGYDLSVYGPNGFLRSFKGGLVGRGRTDLDVRVDYDDDSAGITLVITNTGTHTDNVHVADRYTAQHFACLLAPRESVSRHWALKRSFGWYELVIRVDEDRQFEQVLAGHVETGEDSVSDPGMGTSRRVN